MEKHKIATPVFTLQKKIGVAIIIFGVLMAFAGLYAFAEPLPPVLSFIGKWCFMLWLPILLAGIVVYSSSKNIYKIR